MTRLATLASTGALCLFVTHGATAQQFGTDDIAIQMMRIVEIRSKEAGIAVSSEDRRRLWRYVTKAAAEAYERNSLDEVVPEAEALADRLVQAARRKASAHSSDTRESVTESCPPRSSR